MPMTKEEIRAWSARIRTNADARRKHKCITCGSKHRKPILGRHDDGDGWRAVHWCPTCEAPAFGSDSYVHTKAKELDELAVVGMIEDDLAGDLGQLKFP